MFVWLGRQAIRQKSPAPFWNFKVHDQDPTYDFDGVYEFPNTHFFFSFIESAMRRLWQYNIVRVRHTWV
jgi:hypothetical protein